MILPQNVIKTLQIIPPSLIYPYVHFLRPYPPHYPKQQTNTAKNNGYLHLFFEKKYLETQSR